MKKFFTNMTLQREFQRFKYNAFGNSRLEMAEETGFPIIPAINGYVEQDEEFRVIAVVEPNNDFAMRNLGFLEDDLKALCTRNGLKYPSRGVERVQGPINQRVSENVETFRTLLNYMDDEDELFACVTYGTKPMSMTLLTAIRYAYRLKRDTTVPCIVYGEIKWSENERIANIYDETALIQLDEITRVLADEGIEDPKAMLDSILDL